MVCTRVVALMVLGMALAGGVAGAQPSSPADVLLRLDGSRLVGEVSRSGRVWVVTTVEGERVEVAPEDVARIELAPRPNATAADAALASLRRSSDAQSDPQRVVERYRQFLQMHRGTSVAEDAALDLLMWESRVQRGLRKLGTAWVTAEQANALRSAATDLALRAVADLRESRLAAAEQTLADSLATDPANPTAHYLRGVLLFRQDRLQEARRAFEASLEAAPGHGPTLGNLAVTTYRLGAFGLSMNLYDQALIAMPLERGLLNNVAEALHALPDNQKNNQAARRVQRKFDEQDALLAQRLASLPPPDGPLYRWGATWVNQQQLDQYKAAEARIQAELDQLAGEYDQTVQRIAGIDEQIRRNLDDMRRIEAQSYGTDSAGNPVRFPLPQIYFNLRQQVEQLRADRQQVEARQAQLRSRARAVQAQTPAPKYTGVQQLYAAEAAPVVRTFPVPATTRPR